jgi:hypothetical protein
MRRFQIVAGGMVLMLAACSPSEKSQSDDNLRSDIPLRSVEFLMGHPAEAAEVRAMCDQWKGSQRSIASWPTVVTQNCNNEDSVRMLKIEDEQREKMKRQMGI